MTPEILPSSARKWIPVMGPNNLKISARYLNTLLVHRRYLRGSKRVLNKSEDTLYRKKCATHRRRRAAPEHHTRYFSELNFGDGDAEGRGRRYRDQNISSLVPADNLQQHSSSP